MNKILVGTLLTLLVGAAAVTNFSPERVAASIDVPPSFDIAMPAQQESSDAVPVAAVKLHPEPWQ